MAAIRSSLRYLEEDGDRWLEGEIWVQDGKGCVSCHHVATAPARPNRRSCLGALGVVESAVLVFVELFDEQHFLE